MANMNFGVNILPKANNTYSLGNSDYKWNVYLSSLNGTSLSSTGIATTNNYGLLKGSGSGTGLQLDNNGYIKLDAGTSTQIKTGTSLYAPITAGRQHESVFYGLTKAAGVDMAASNNTVGTYTSAAKLAIANMLSMTPTSNIGIVEEGNSASTNITEGQYVIWKGALYRASTAISSGTTLSTSTNLTAVSNGGLNDLFNNTSTVFNDVYITRTSSLEHTITLPTATMQMVYLAGIGSVERFWLGHVYVNNSGGVRIHEINTGTNVTASIPENTTNTLKFTMDAAQAVKIRIFNVYGSAAVQ